MPWYLVTVQGQNMLLNYRGDVAKYGFRTKRYVQAEDEKGAENMALDKVMNDPELHEIIRNGPDDPPTVSVEEIQESSRPEGVRDRDVKNLFYREHEA